MNTKNEYMLLFSSNEWWNKLSLAEIQLIARQNKAWVEGLIAKGKVKGAQALAREGATLSGKNPRVIVDGPFAESKEVVGGYLVIEAESLDEAIAISKDSPSLHNGATIAIRPLADECPLDARIRQLASQEQLATANV
jgi:hypothetical protein